MKASQIPHLRLASLGIAPVSQSNPAELLSRLGALQAQDYDGVKFSLGLRLGATAAAIEAAIAAGGILRTWPMRGTLHLVPAIDARWMLDLMTPRLHKTYQTRHSQLGLRPRELELSGEILAQALQGATLSREDLLARLEAGGISCLGQRGYHLLTHHAQEGLICCGPLLGKQQSFRLLSDVVPRPRVLARDEALAVLSERFYRSHGPASCEDFARWTGLTLGDARKGLSLARERYPQLAVISAEGRELWYDAAIAPAPRKQVQLLPGFDEYLLGYKDRSAVLDPAQAQRICPGNNGVFAPTIISDGQVCGTWKRKLSKRSLQMSLSPFRELTPAEREGVAEAAAAYAAYLEAPEPTLSFETT